jgi:DNA-directed RNA polymerase sigma subunit (sigma70/sigma32)
MPRKAELELADADRSFEAIARELGCTRQRAQQIFASALRKLRRELERRRVKSTGDALPE